MWFQLNIILQINYTVVVMISLSINWGTSFQTVRFVQVLQIFGYNYFENNNFKMAKRLNKIRDH